MASELRSLKEQGDEVGAVGKVQGENAMSRRQEVRSFAVFGLI